MIVDIYCQVIDNYGDIAIVYRLARSLKHRRPQWQLRLVVDNLKTFQDLCPQVDPQAADQTLDFGRVILWNGVETLDFWKTEPPDLVIPFLGCEIPGPVLEWLGTQAPPSPHLTHRLVILIEYLTAEAWSEDTHRLPSLVPYPSIQKYFFVPGFRPGAGGILQEEAFTQARDRSRENPLVFRRTFLAQRGWAWASEVLNLRWWSVFTYEHPFQRLVEDLESSNQGVLVFLAPGRPQAGFLEVLKDRGYARTPQGLWKKGLVQVFEMPFLSQEAYDHLVLACDMNIVRGEESWMRGVLSGKPFLWQAYLQDEGYQLVKVQAFWEVLAPWLGAHCEPLVLEEVQESFEALNRRRENQTQNSLGERYGVFLENPPGLAQGFREFADYLDKNADLTRKLLDFIETFRI